MGKRFAVLTKIEDDYKITAETDLQFLYHVQHALLLALRERGTISTVQYWKADEALRKQRREFAKRVQEKR